MVKCTEFKHHPVKVNSQELYFNNAETSMVAPDGRALVMLRENGASVCRLFFDNSGNLVFMPSTTTQGIVIEIATRSLKWIKGKNMTCNTSINHP